MRALSACVDDLQKRQTRRFLQGLAADELQYIAEFLGSCILESSGRFRCSRMQLAEAIRRFDGSRHSSPADARCPHCADGWLPDPEHKMILLLEYLCRSGIAQFTLGVGAGQS